MKTKEIKRIIISYPYHEISNYEDTEIIEFSYMPRHIIEKITKFLSYEELSRIPKHGWPSIEELLDYSYLIAFSGKLIINPKKKELLLEAAYCFETIKNGVYLEELARMYDAAYVEDMGEIEELKEILLKTPDKLQEYILETEFGDFDPAPEDFYFSSVTFLT